MGAVPLIASVSAFSHEAGKPIPGFFVRKAVKDHGTKKRIDGIDSVAGKKVAILEDVTTTGGSAIQAVEEVRAAGAEVVLVLSIVDRLEGCGGEFRGGEGALRFALHARRLHEGLIILAPVFLSITLPEQCLDDATGAALGSANATQPSRQPEALMSLDADAIVDRRRLRRKLTLWRTLALIAAVGVIAAIYAASGGAGLIGETRPHVARVTVGGIIRTDRDRICACWSASDVPARKPSSFPSTVPAARSSAPNSSMTACAGFRRKPVVAVVNGLAASGGYVVAMGGERIFAQPQRDRRLDRCDLSDAERDRTPLKTVGVAVDDIKSSPLKAQPNPYSPTPPEARKAMEALGPRQLRLVPRSRARAPQARRRRSRPGRRRPRLHRQSGDAAQARRRDRRRAGGARLAGEKQGGFRRSARPRLAPGRIGYRVRLAGVAGGVAQALGLPALGRGPFQRGAAQCGGARTT
jgi:hypothetical protein